MPVIFTGGVQVPVVFGNGATIQHLFAVENGIASRVDILVRRLTVRNDTIAVLTSVMPQVKVSRGTNISGGIMLAKETFDTLQGSSSFVNFRSAMGEGSHITATQGDTIWQQYVTRMHTVVEQVLDNEDSLLPRLVVEDAFNLRLRPGQSLLATVVGATAASNATITNNWMIGCTWEEDEIATFAISGTVTLSGSPVSGAIVTVIEADDIDMTNAVLRETIVTPAGGTWASSIRTGKVGAAFVQYRVGATYYTAPGSPYLA